MLIFQLEVCYEKSLHYRDFQVFHNVQGFITLRLCFCIVILVACSLCLYECIDSKFKTAYKKATITAFSRKLYFEECLGYGENLIMFRFFRECIHSPPKSRGEQKSLHSG